MKTIRPHNNNGTIQIKFSVDGKRYSFNPIPRASFNDRAALAKARQIAAQIESDIFSEAFDSTLEKYRKRSLCNLAVREKPMCLLALWDLWVESLEISEHTKADHYQWIRRMIEKAQPLISDSNWFLNNNLAAKTFNTRLSYLNSCCKWAVEKGFIVLNPYSSIKPRKTVKAEIKPFTAKEIQLITTRFEKRFPHYASFVRFFFMTGVRTSEAIGLTWGHINFEKNEFVINESLSIDRTGNGYKRIRKSTKTGSVRYLNMTPQLREMLLKLKSKQSGNTDLVFTSSKGKHIDAGNFREDWKLILQDVNVPYRKPYTTRHTLISNAIEQGIPLTGVAYIAGHRDTQMVMKTYGHMINRPELPQIAV
jgi:integrase